ncbi:sodium-dependent transporter [Celerinatantimonas sp. YJH-8]|uniref:sodium-dependent transporter n=1 Tax=Celerinatantimonas sp. YJH-8 TaxID=3228714 RepID=UPI0038C80567
MTNTTSVSNRWSSKFAYVLAATGAAVGLGNLWKFPYIMGENGGGAFVLVYLICIVLIGIPVMMAEVYIGKEGRSTPAHAMAKVAQTHGLSKRWGLNGAMAVIAGFLILSFYAMIAGWAVAYIYYSADGQVSAAAGNADVIGTVFSGLLGSASKLILFTTIVIVAAVYVLSRGVNKGLEQAVRYLMPALFILLVIVMLYSCATGDFAGAFHFMFYPDFSKLSFNGVIIALGHAFFTLSLSLGIMVMYGAYLPEGTSIAKTSVAIAVADTVVALIAGLAIYPVVFAHHIAPGAGPGLLFKSLPIAFSNMPMGGFISTLFFIMVTFAAFTSVIALFESPVAYFVERRGMSRTGGAIVCGILIWLLSLGSIYSMTGADWATPSKWAIFDFAGAQNLFGVIGHSFFDILDYVTANIMLPVGGFVTAIFVGWFMKSEKRTARSFEMQRGFGHYLICVRFISPLAILLVFLNAVGVL